MSTYMNEFGEFVELDPPDVDERRRRIYASCVEVDPTKARGTVPRIPPKPRPGGPVIGICEECGEPYEKKKHVQRFCSRKCQRANYKAEQREIRKLKREMRP